MDNSVVFTISIYPYLSFPVAFNKQDLNFVFVNLERQLKKKGHVRTCPFFEWVEKELLFDNFMNAFPLKCIHFHNVNTRSQICNINRCAVCQ
jgi:hypothetical protein